MSKIVNLFEEADALSGHDLKLVRKEFGLTRLQASKALEIPVGTLEWYEGKASVPLSLSDVKLDYEDFVAKTDENVGKNLIFHYLPLRVGREIMGLSLVEMAVKYNYSVDSWKKFEYNQRELKPDLLEQIQQDVREQFKAICA